MIRENIKKILKTIITEQEDNKVVITPQKYLEFLEFVSWDGRKINNLKQFKGKEIVIDGDLHVNGTPVVNLGNITINGKLDISNTAISTLNGIKVSGYVFDHGSEYRKRINYLEFLKEKEAQDELRKEGAWEGENLNDLASCANALFEHLTGYEYDAKEPDDNETIEKNRKRIEEIESIEGYNENSDLVDEIETLTEEIDELSKRIDVYDLIPDGKFYRLYLFKVATNEGKSKEQWAVGDNYDTDLSARESTENLIDDVGLDGFRQSFVEYYIDEEELKDWFREGEYDNVRDNLDSYFDEDEFEYSEEVQNRMDEIEEKLENPEGLSQEELDELNEELDELRDSDKDIPEHMIDDKVESILDDLADNPEDTIKNYGLELSNFVDMRKLIEGVVESDGYGNILNHYNGGEDTIVFDGDTYYIFQMEG